MNHETKRIPVRDISLIHRGDRIEACRGDQTCYSGDVKDTAPGLGIVWIREEGRHGRRALSLDDFSILKVPRKPKVPADGILG